MRLSAWGNWRTAVCVCVCVSSVSWPSALFEGCNVAWLSCCGACRLGGIVIYSLRTRTYFRKVSRSLFYLWTYSTFRVSFRRQTTFKFSSLPEHTQRKNLTVATNACRVTRYRWRIDRKWTPRPYTRANFCLSWGVVWLCDVYTWVLSHIFSEGWAVASTTRFV